MKKKNKGKIITVGERLEGFMDWVDPNASDLVEEWEDNLSNLAAGFVAWIRKQAASAQGETTLGSEVSRGKRRKWSSPDEETQRSSTVIVVDSPERASDALPALEGAAQDASQEACVMTRTK